MPLSYDKNKVRILLLEGISPTARAVLKSAGYTNIEEYPKALAGNDLIEKLAGVRVLGIRSTTQLSKDALESADKLMVVGCFCIGTNQVDLGMALTCGIPVFNAPFANTRSVAELAISSIIALMRRTPEKNLALHRGIWTKSAKGSREVRGKTLGIVGYGNIGTQLSVLAEHLGMNVYYYDIEKKLPLGNTRPISTFHELLQISDVVSLHVPETSGTKNMIGAKEIALMKPGACLINYSRGKVVDIEALAEALKSGHLAGAAIDVFPKEPKSKDEEFVSPLRGLDNALLSPHVGGSTEEAQEAIGIEVADKIVRYIDNGSTTGAVNFPHVALPQHPGAYRILNIHKNIPGVLGQLNAVFAEAKANVAGQFLQTNTEIGYVVTDIAGVGDPEIFRAALKTIPGSIRTRILH
ncbi:phosphoglycerate dehydrogenase [Candidatus Kaiserbacteria bacterium]|nr:phosphoglycerate dehydrogenase [Candidatus Kaiserbacteria bacterium]